jgi:proton glutamate symport protein
MALRLPALQLHNKILLALFLGAIFGAVFHVATDTLEITHIPSGEQESTRETIHAWERIQILDADTDTPLSTFGAKDQPEIVSRVAQLRHEHRNIILTASFAAASPRRFVHVLAVDRVSTIAVWIKPVGTVFIRLLMFVAIPLVLASLIVGSSSLGDFRKVGGLGARTFGLYILTTLFALAIGLALVNLIRPGAQLNEESRDRLMVEYRGNIHEKIEQETSVDLVEMLVSIVATNPLRALARGEMLQIIFFALMVGISLTLIPPEKASPVIRFFDGFSELMIKMVDMIMVIAPYGVFALISATVAEFGFDILQTLAWYAATVVIGLLLHLAITLSSLIRFLARMSPVRFIKAIRPALLIAFSSSSSAATLPVTMEVVEQRIGVPKKFASFVLPLGATINMDGTSLYQAVAAVFIAQVYGLDLGLSSQLTIVLTALLASIGTAPVPGVGLIMLIIVLRSVHIPEEGIALILGIDRILDMCRTAINVTGDATVTTIIARQEGVLADVHNGPASPAL